MCPKGIRRIITKENFFTEAKGITVKQSEVYVNYMCVSLSLIHNGKLLFCPIQCREFKHRSPKIDIITMSSHTRVTQIHIYPVGLSCSHLSLLSPSKSISRPLPSFLPSFLSRTQFHLAQAQSLAIS